MSGQNLKKERNGEIEGKNVRLRYKERDRERDKIASKSLKMSSWKLCFLSALPMWGGGGNTGQEGVQKGVLTFK